MMNAPATLPPALMKALHAARRDVRPMWKDTPGPHGDYVHADSVFEEADRVMGLHGLMLVPPVTLFDPVIEPFRTGGDKGPTMVGKRHRVWILIHVPSDEQYPFVSEIPVDANASTGGVVSFKKASTSEEKDFLWDLLKMRATDEQVGYQASAPSASSGVNPDRKVKISKPAVESSSDTGVDWGDDVKLALSLGAFPGGPDKKNADGQLIVMPSDPTVDDLVASGWIVGDDSCSARMLVSMGQTSDTSPVHGSLLKDLDAAARRSGRTTEDIKKLFAHVGAEYKKDAEVSAYQARLFALCTAKWSGEVK